MSVLIVDDHPVVRRGLRGMLSRAEDVEVVGEASDAYEALEKAATLRPDVLLLDIRMPGMDGLQLLHHLKRDCPEVKTLILTNYDDEEFLTEAFREGADGYLLKNAGRQELLDALQSVHEGKRTLSEELMDSVLRQFGDLGQRQAKRQFDLSGREVDLLRLVADGFTNRQIAEQMYWSENTVKRKLSEIFQKLHVSDRAQAAAFAVRQGLI